MNALERLVSGPLSTLLTVANASLEIDSTNVSESSGLNNDFNGFY